VQHAHQKRLQLIPPLDVKLAPWNLQEATYDKAMWILGSTPDLNLEELSTALNQDKFLKDILPVEVVWDKIESEYLEEYEEGQRPFYAAHICCPKDTAIKCVDQIILMFASTRKTGYPLDTIFQCIVNTGSRYCTAQTAKDRRKTVTLRELHQIRVQDSDKSVLHFPNMMAPLHNPGSRTLKQFLQGRQTKDKRPIFFTISPSTQAAGFYVLTYSKEHKKEVHQTLRDLVLLCRDIHGDAAKSWFTDAEWTSCEATFRQNSSSGRWASIASKQHDTLSDVLLLQYIDADEDLAPDDTCVLEALRGRPFKPPDVHTTRRAPRQRTSDASHASTRVSTLGGGISTLGGIDDEETLASLALGSNQQDSLEDMDTDSVSMLQDPPTSAPPQKLSIFRSLDISRLLPTLDLPQVSGSSPSESTLVLSLQTDTNLLANLKKAIKTMETQLEDLNSSTVATIQDTLFQTHAENCPPDMTDTSSSDFALHASLTYWLALHHGDLALPEEALLGHLNTLMRIHSSASFSTQKAIFSTYLANVNQSA